MKGLESRQVRMVERFGRTADSDSESVAEEGVRIILRRLLIYMGKSRSPAKLPLAGMPFALSAM